MWRWFSVLANRRTLMMAVSAALTLAGGAFVVATRGYPDPIVADEFAYLLGADTFASGRLTNPQHPLWIFFETLHVIVRPTYQMMYPPAQSVALALGTLIAGHPWWGVWATCGLMSAAVCWMFYAWLPPRWAALGAVLFSVRIGAFGYWMDSYWGGAVGAIGGALVLGALPKMLDRLRARHAALMAVGLALLANTRPYEGVVLAACVGVALVYGLWKSWPGWPIVARRIVVPMLIVLVPAATMMGLYFWRVTGDPLVMPYQVARRTYGIRQPLLGFARNREPVYNHKELAAIYRWELREHLTTAEKLRSKIEGPVTFFFGLPLLVPFVMLPWMWRDRRVRFLLVTGGVMAVGLLIEQWVRPHYVAPVAGLLFVLLLQAMRHLAQVGWGRWRIGPLLVAAVLVAFASRQGSRVFSRFEAEWSTHRAALIRTLEAGPDRHVIVVHYDPSIELHADWLANVADIDNAKVVWAREMDPARMRELVAYFGRQGRKMWMIDADVPNAPLRPLPTY